MFQAVTTVYAHVNYMNTSLIFRNGETHGLTSAVLLLVDLQEVLLGAQMIDRF